ncbi:hypothetical protein AA13594_2891 [Gluconacetobacter azotocaptans DSM 13594]|nr:hypothetical protein AA13594_2891 [Gluconacetobacter azotocaptans DSM 13594]
MSPAGPALTVEEVTGPDEADAVRNWGRAADEANPVVTAAAGAAAGGAGTWEKSVPVISAPEFVDALLWLPCTAGDDCETRRAAVAAAISAQLAVPVREALDDVPAGAVSDVPSPASDEPAFSFGCCSGGGATCMGAAICIRATAGHASVFCACCLTFRASSAARPGCSSSASCAGDVAGVAAC